MPEIEIRNNPGFLSFLRKITEISLTGFVWGIWLYLLLPIINILLWVVGISSIYTEVFEKVGYLEFFKLIQKMGWVVLIAFIVFRGWGYYNYRRFGKRNKRSSFEEYRQVDLASYFKITPEEVEQLTSEKEVPWPPVQ